MNDQPQPNRSQSNRRLTIARAMTEAIQQEMSTDSSVMVLGEDVGKLGGVFANTKGLLAEFGAERVRDTPISESAFIGAGVGLAANGYRPVVELMFVDFFGVCMDAIYNLAARQSYFSAGKFGCPMVLMTSVGGGYGDAAQHSQCLYATFGHLPGMKVVIPSNAHDAKGMMIAAIRDPDPVIFMFHKAIQGMGWMGNIEQSVNHVPAESYTIPLNEANVVRQGSDITIVSLGALVHAAREAAEELQADDIDAEVIDLRSIAPLDRTTIKKSVLKTGRLVVLDDDYHSCGLAGELIASMAEEPEVEFRAAPVRVCHPDVPPPFAREMEHHLLPKKSDVLSAVRSAMQGVRI